MEEKIANSGKGGPARFHPGAWMPLARAFVAFHRGDPAAELRVITDQGEAEAMPVSVFFRGRGELREVDRSALRHVKGRILDGGAGVGSLALLLQEDGCEVCAVEVIPEAVQIMKERGVRDARLGALEDLPLAHAFDTVLLLMNGTALAGTVRGFPRLLESLRRLLRPGGQVLLDSTDLGERARGETQSPADDPPDGGAVGPVELHYQLEFAGVKGDPFPQLFLDPGSLAKLCRAEGWEAGVLLAVAGGEYLARLTPPEHPRGA